MVKAGLTDGVTTTNSDGCSRGVAAQVALNGLKAELVKYDGTPTTVSTGTVTVTTGQSAAKKDDWQSGDKENYKSETKANANPRFMNRYQKDLKLNPTTADAFGRPDTNKWTYKGESVYTAKSSSNKLATYANKQDEKVIYELLDSHDARKTNTSYSFWVDGKETASGTALKADSASWKNSTSKIGNSGNGTQIEVYYDSTKGTDGAVTVVMYNYYLVKATADYSANNKKVKIEWISDRPAGTPAEIEQKDFNVENVKEDDYLVVTVAGTDIKSVAPATKVTGNISAFTTGNNITVDGTKYTRANKFDSNVGGTSAFNELKTGSDVTLVLDPNNYVLATRDETSSNQYVYIFKVGSNDNLDDEGKAIAYFVDGTRQTITLDTGNGAATAVANTWFNYSVKSNGKYKLTAIPTTTGSIASGKFAYAHTSAAANLKLTGDAIVYTDCDAKPGNANNATVFLTLKSTDTKVNAKTYTGLKAPKTASATAISAVMKDGKALYVFAIAGKYSGASSSDYILLYGGKTSGKTDFDNVTSGDNQYWEYGKTFLNGTQQTTQFGNETMELDKVTAQMYYGVSYDSDGRVEGSDGAVPVTFAGKEFYQTTASKAVQGVSYADGVITVGIESFKVADTATATVIEGSTIETPSFTGLKGSLDDNDVYHVFFVFTNDKDNIVKAVYFVK
jgi:hypothetical protein